MDRQVDLLDFALPPLRDYLPAEAYAEACDRARRIRFSDGDFLHLRGDADARLYLIAKGAVRLGRFQPSGAFNLVAMVGIGGHFGEVAMQRKGHTHDAYAIGNVDLDILDTRTLNDMLDNTPGFARGLWDCNTARLNALLELYDDVRTLGVTARLGKVIYLHAGRGSIPGGIACTQKDLSELLGVTTVSVGNAVKELESLGLITQGYRKVLMSDKKQLRAWLRDVEAI